MKKILLSIMLLAIFPIFVACSKSEKKYFNCTLQESIVDGVKTTTNYKVIYDGDYVKEIETTETIESNDEEYLETIKEANLSTYSLYKSIDYYDYNIVLKNNKLITTTKIDYQNIDYDELLVVNQTTANLIENDNLRVSDIKKSYSQMGIVCK